MKLSLTPDVTIRLCGVPNPLNPPPPTADSGVFPRCATFTLSADAPPPQARTLVFFYYCGWIGFKRQRRHRKISNGNFKDHTHTRTQTQSFPPVTAQTAEQMTLTEACKCAKDKLVNIYTDSHYAYSIKQGSGTHWSHR